MTEPPDSMPQVAASVLPTARRVTPVLITLVLVCAVFLIYAGVSGQHFVNYDDGPYVFRNQIIVSGLTWGNVAWAFTHAHAQMWHPISSISLMIDCDLYGLPPSPSPQIITAPLATGHKLSSVGYHALAAVLTFVAFRMMTGHIWTSAFLAALFLVHPLRVESVAWVTERKDVLSGVFWMLTLICYCWYVHRPKFARYTVLVGVLAIALMSKPTVVTLPFVLLLLDYWPLNRLRFGQHAGVNIRPLAEPRPFWWLIVEKLPLLAMSAGTSVVTYIAQSGVIRDVNYLPVWPRLLNALGAYAFYIKKTIWPTDLAVLYPHRVNYDQNMATNLVAPAVVGALVVGTILVLVLLFARRLPYLPVGWFWFLGTLIPMIGLVQVGKQAYADRYSYLSGIGLLIIVAWGAREVVERRVARRWIVVTCGLLALAAAGIATRSQVAVWHNTLTLFKHASEVTENNFLAHNFVGGQYAQRKRYTEARQQYKKAIQIKPDYFRAWINLAKICRAQREYEAELNALQQAYQLRSSGDTLRKIKQAQRRVDEAERARRDKNRQQPRSPPPSASDSS